MEKNREVQISKFLSYVLRHKPESIGLTLNEGGWADVHIILRNAQPRFSLEELIYVVMHNDKKRFSFNDNYTLIKANQGHSTEVTLTFRTIVPPNTLYHGTAEPFVDSILKQGLLKGKRHHVHLSKDIATAIKVGQRHGKTVIFAIAAGKMYKEGYSFYISDNDVYLVDYVPVTYLQRIAHEK